MRRTSSATVTFASIAVLALLSACGAPSSASPAPVVTEAPAAVASPVAAPVAVAVAAPVPAGPAVARTPLALLVTGDVWGEYAPCG